jgi:hypothetical protein
MRRIMCVLLVVTGLALPAFSQDAASPAYLPELSEKKQATFGDAVSLFVMTLGRRPANFAAERDFLVRENVLVNKKDKENDPLRRGTLALMAARYLKLGDSLMYAVFGTGRYAFTACVANDIMYYQGGERDVLSGDELIEIMARVGEKAGGAK